MIKNEQKLLPMILTIHSKLKTVVKNALLTSNIKNTACG